MSSRQNDMASTQLTTPEPDTHVPAVVSRVLLKSWMAHSGRHELYFRERWV
jgi:hypothetical protein